MIFDAHCHAWERWPYKPEVPDPDSRGRAENLLWEMELNGIGRAIVICASIAGNPENNAYAFGHPATRAGRLVPFADADSRWWPHHHTPGAAGRLDQLIQRFRPRSITHYMNEEADTGWLLSEDGLAFARTAEVDGLILSLACGPFQVPTVAALAERVPALSMRSGCSTMFLVGPLRSWRSWPNRRPNHGSHNSEVRSEGSPTLRNQGRSVSLSS